MMVEYFGYAWIHNMWLRVVSDVISIGSINAGFSICVDLLAMA